MPCSFRDKSLKVLSWIPSSSKGGKQHRKRHLRRRLVRLAALMWTTLNPFFFYFFFFVIYEVRSLCDKWNASSKNGLRVNIIKRGIHAPYYIPWQVGFFEEGKKLWGYSRIVSLRYLLPMMMLGENRTICFKNIAHLCICNPTAQVWECQSHPAIPALQLLRSST